jgi:zinc protease
MPSTFAALSVEPAGEVGGLAVVRQAPPPGAGSFSATYVAPSGWAHEPIRLAGLARMANQLAASATVRFDRVALARRLDRAGATLSYQCAPESGEIRIWGPAADWKPLLGLLAEVVRSPRFAPEDVARVRRQSIERALRESTQPANRAERELLRRCFPAGHPYATTGRGDRTTLGRIRRSDLAKFYRLQYGRRDACLVVTGAPSAAAVLEAARAGFGGLPDGSPARLRTPAARSRPAPPVRVDLPGRSQVELRLGGSSIPRTDPAYPAAALANEILGGRPMLSRLFQRVREQGGLAYHASSSLEAMRYGGYWSVQAGTGADRWRKALPMLREEVTRLSEELVPPAQLDRIRESTIGEIPLALETTAEAHELAVDVAYHGLEPDYWLRWPARLRAVTRAQLRDAARRAFDPTRATTVVVGPLTTRG